MPSGQPIHLDTNGFILRSLIAADITPRFLTWLSSPEMLRGLNLNALAFDLDGLRKFVASFDHHNNYFIGIFDAKNGLLVGFYTIDVSHVHRVGQLTAGVGEADYSRKKVLWATIDALIDHFYAERSIEKFSARILARNYAMLFNFKDNPRFVLEACLEQECLAADGTRLDLLIFSSFKTPLPGKRSASLPPK